MAGLTTTGITIKSLDDVLSDIEAAELANIDSQLNVGADDVLGQLNGVVAAAIAELWELLEEIYQSAYPDTASGQSLSYVSALTGALRQAATKAEIIVAMTGTPDIVVPTGTRAYLDGDPDSLFETTAPVTLTGGFVTGITMLAVTAGSATSGTSNENLVIDSPVTGLDTISAIIGAAFTEGSDEETDSELRIRREQTLALAGSSTVEAIRADMLQVTGVDTCTVFENPSSVTDANGVPPYAIEVLVYSAGAPSYVVQDVIDQIWLSKPAGTETYGTETPGTATDSQGNDHTIYYSEPSTVRCYLYVHLNETTDGTYVDDSGVAQAIEDWAVRSLEVGQSVYASDIVNVVADVAGVLNVVLADLRIDDSPSRTTIELVATARQLITIAASDVLVLSS